MRRRRARLREAGAIIFSKTTMPDYGMTSSGVSSFHPLTRNAWDLSKNPGGSSSGAGAAGAAGYGPLHVGTDIGGSVRLPAGWCGLVGLKPSLGRIPIDPPYVARCAGPMTRTVDDTALLMSVLSQPDHRDGMSLPVQDIDWMNLSADLKGKRIGLLLEAGVGIPVEPEVKAAVEAAAKWFADQGAVVEPVAPLMTRTILQGLDTFFRARSWSDIEPLPAEQRAKIHPYTRKWAEGGAKLSGVEAIRGFNQTLRIAPARGTAVRQDRLPDLADRPGPGLRGGALLARRRSGAAVRAHLLHGAVEFHRAAGRVDQRGVHDDRAADRRADHRPAPRRSRRAQAREGLGDRARSDHELADSAKLSRALRSSAPTTCRSFATVMHCARTTSVAASRSGTMIAIMPAACADAMP